MCHIFAMLLISLSTFSLSVSANAQEDRLRPLPDFLQDTPDVAPPLIPEAAPPPVQEDSDDFAPSLLAPTPRQSEQNTSTSRDDLKDIPDEYIEEAIAFGRECSSDPQMQLYFDCRCMTVKYLDRRIELGKDAHFSAVRLGVGPQCADGTGIAGQLFEGCKGRYSQIPAGKDPEDFCSCYGNTYAKLYENYGRVLRSPQHVSFMAQARMACTNSENARRIYGNNPLFPQNIQ